MPSTDRALLNALPLVLAAAVMSAVPASADTIAPDIDSFTLYAGRNVTLGAGSVVDGPLGAGNDLSAGTDVSLNDAFVDRDIHLGARAVVRGTVLANRSAEAGSDLDFEGPSWTGWNVCLGPRASVVGRVASNTGGTAISSHGHVVGDITSNYTVYIASDSTVEGNVSPGMGGHFIVGDNVTITGAVASGRSPFDVFEAPGLGDEPRRDACGTRNVSQGDGAVRTLAPGAYNDVDMWGADTTLTLSAGAYAICELWIASGGTVNADTADGDVILNVHKRLAAGSDVTFDVTGPGSFEINLFDNDLRLGRDAAVEADIRVWDGSFRAEDNFSLVGRVWADKDIHLGGSPAVALPVEVPEPSAMLLLTCGALLGIRPRRRAG